MLYDDFFVMLDDILNYVKKHPGCEVLSADDPLARRIGFTTRVPEETWLTMLRHRPWVKWGLLGRLLPFLKPKRELLGVWEIPLIKIRNATTDVSEERRLRLKEYLMTPMGRNKMSSALTRGVNPLGPNMPQ